MQTQTQQPSKKIGILGIGNILLSDEGFGIHFIQHVQEHYNFPDNIEILDAGTAGIYMAPFMESVSKLIVIDAVDINDEPGTIKYFRGDEVKAGLIPAKMSPHQLGLLDILEICKLRGQAPDEVEFICVVPQSLETGLSLTPVVENKLKDVEAMLLDSLKENGVAPTPL